MKRGRIFIYLALIIIIAVAAGAAYLWLHRPASTSPSANATQANLVVPVEIIMAGQNIPPGTAITEAMLSSMQIPANMVVQGEFTNKADVVNMYAKYQISQGVVITDSMVTVAPGNVNLGGSAWARYIPQGFTAVSIPVTRLSSAAYGIQDYDWVDIIVTMQIVDIDPTLQTILPDMSAVVSSPLTSAGAPSLTVQIASGGDASKVGYTGSDSTLNQPIYLVPSEGQRPRTVTQTILQKVQVLHIGNFLLPGDPCNTQPTSETAATPTPAAGQQTGACSNKSPDIVTLMVTPQDANTLVYLIYSGAKINLTLRDPNDQGKVTQTDAVTLEYLLTQYDIPVPAKLPYASQPKVDGLTNPLPITTPAP